MNSLNNISFQIESIIETSSKKLSDIQSSGVLKDDINFFDLEKLIKTIPLKHYLEDNYALDMINVIRMFQFPQHSEKKNRKKIWELQFVYDLARCLITCSDLTDDIDRECCTCRIFRWFQETYSCKENEFRILPYHDSQLNVFDMDEHTNFGLVYNKPETDTEKKLHLLWVSKRKQEILDAKLKSQVESTLSHLIQEKNKNQNRVLQRKVMKKYDVLENDNLNLINPTGHSNGRILHQSSLVREQHDSSVDMETVNNANMIDSAIRSKSSSDKEYSVQEISTQNQETYSFQASGNNVGIKGVLKMKGAVKFDGQPIAMRFSSKPLPFDIYKSEKSALAMKYRDIMNHSQNYMNQSDEDDSDDNADLLDTAEPASEKLPENSIKHYEKQSTNASLKVFSSDPEYKVFHRHANYRRTPLTQAQEQWLLDREKNRLKVTSDILLSLQSGVKSKVKSKNKKLGSKKAKNSRGKNRKSLKEAKTATLAPIVVPPPPMYPNAKLFMEHNFVALDPMPEINRQQSPFLSTDISDEIEANSIVCSSYDGDQDRLGDKDIDITNDNRSIGPMRMTQIVEYNEIITAFRKMNLPVDEATLCRALIAPQDLPDVICKEILHDKTSNDKLLKNPFPSQLWRKLKIVKKRKKGKPSKKKK